MFASQLLKILQTIPSDVKYETCAYDSAEQDMTMKENQNGTDYDSKSFHREADSLAFGSKEIYQLDGLRRETHPSVFEAKGGGGYWNPFVDEFSMDNQNGTIDSTVTEFQNGLLYHPISLDDADSLFKDTNAQNQLQRSAEHECAMIVEEFTRHNETEPKDSILPYIAASKTDTNLYTDKNVLEPPETIVCYKEVNYYAVKDICVDAGMPVNGKISIESSKYDQSGHCFSRPLNDDTHCEATEEAGDKELSMSDWLAASSLDNAKGIISANENESKEEIHGNFAEERPNLSSDSSFDKDTAKHFGTEDSMQKSETNLVTTGKTVTDASEEDSFIDRTLPIQEFGTRSFLRSFLNDLDGEGNRIQQLPDQVRAVKKITSVKAVSNGLAASSAEAGPEEDVQATSVYHNSSKDTSIGKVHEQSINISDDFSSNSQAQCVSSNDMSDETAHDQSSDHKDENSDDHSSDRHLQFASSKNVDPISSNGQAVEPHVLKHESRDFGNDSVVSQEKYDEGESSFSAAGFINYSGPIAFSGSISLRSDGSATSGRSFAFPVLQSEWNSSPVRMRKPDGKHFKKHKGWRSGLLCCRF